MKADTIAAIATSMSDSGIGIIRVSGDDAVMIVDKVFRNSKNQRLLSKYDSHTIHYGFMIQEDGSVVDEVMVSIMKAPRSYTMEDTVEINCHGGILMMRKVLDIVLQAGARIAEPGEFTKRAFLNGRIDLSRAEAVMDIIQAKNEFALQSSVKQLKGSISDKIRNLREEIIYEIAFIESALDDPEHISLEGYHDKLSVKTNHILCELDKLLSSADNGRILKEGINTVIVGKPNAGKSSLLNILTGEDKAIVTDVAGTTRDSLEEIIYLDGIMLNIVDTAGIRNTEDVVEKIGVERARRISEDADLILYVVDSSVPLDENDEDIIRMIKDKKVIVLLNKSDLNEVVNENDMVHAMNRVIEDANKYKIIRTSTKEDIGIEILINFIKEMFFHGKITYNDEVFITNTRHKELIREARESMGQVHNSLEMDMPEDFYSIDLMNAYVSLGMIIGEEIGDDLVNEIFSKFCMGK